MRARREVRPSPPVTSLALLKTICGVSNSRALAARPSLLSRTLAYAMSHMDGIQPIHFAILREVGMGRKGWEGLSGRLGT